VKALARTITSVTFFEPRLSSLTLKPTLWFASRTAATENQQFTQTYFDRLQEAERTIFKLNTKIASLQTSGAEQSKRIDALTRELYEKHGRIVELAKALAEKREVVNSTEVNNLRYVSIRLLIIPIC